MFIFDILKHDDRRLRVVAGVIGAGLFVLLAGLWFVQIVYASRYESNSKKQAWKEVGIPSIRGRILDCDGRVLADNQPQYNAILYLEDLQSQFSDTYKALTKAYGREHPQSVLKSGKVSLPAGISKRLQLEADCYVVSNITFNVSYTLQEPRILNTNAFLRHYASHPYVPFEIVPDLQQKQVARFAEQLSAEPELELETQPVRAYPNGALAAHVLGFVQREKPDSEQISYALPDYEGDYVGKSGVERLYDEQLHGQAGVKMVLVNSMNYRQREDMESPNAPGDDIYLTVDRNVQIAAEQGLAAAQKNARGAVVVMDVRNGDILAMASAPSFDPNSYVAGLTKGDVQELQDPKYTPQLNRAIDGAYPPGSTFKIITAIACMETGMNPDDLFDSPGYFQASPNARPVRDTAGSGKFDFHHALFRSSNTYFIVNGLKAGLPKILEVAKRFHLGEKTDFILHPEVAGDIPTPDEARTGHHFSVPDVCIGQEITATPLQMAGMICAIANGGKIYWPRLVSHLHSPETGQDEVLCEPGRLRDTVRIDPHQLELIHRAMLADTEHAAETPSGPDGAGTAYREFHDRDGKPKLSNFRVAGKTGTAELKGGGPNSPHRITWFDSFGPFENPRYAVVVMVEDGSFGGPTCAPTAEKIYEALIKREQSKSAPATTLARN